MGASLLDNRLMWDYPHDSCNNIPTCEINVPPTRALQRQQMCHNLSGWMFQGQMRQQN